MSDKRDELRTQLIGNKHEADRKLVTLFGVEIELQQPTLGSMLEARLESDERERAADIFIRYAFVPGTDDRVFEEGDREAILNWPYTKELLEVQKSVMELTGINIQDAEEALIADPLDASS